MSIFKFLLTVPLFVIVAEFLRRLNDKNKKS